MSTWLVYAGASSARLSSLESGAVDAAILTAPFNFYGASAGLSIIGRTADYITDLPQNGTVVNRNWATGHMSALSRFLVWLQVATGKKDIDSHVAVEDVSELIDSLVERSDARRQHGHVHSQQAP